MTRSAVVASAVAALLLAGCGHAVRDSVKTSGEAAERAVREWERCWPRTRATRRAMRPRRRLISRNG